MFVKKSMKKILIILLLLTPLLLAQYPSHKPGLPLLNKIPIFIEIHVIPGDSLNTIDFTYRLPYNQLTFTKDGNEYSAKLNLSVEIFDTAGQFISRQMKQSNIQVDDFSMTNSADYFCEDYLTFNLANSEYNFIPIINDVQSGQELKLEQIPVHKIKSDSVEFIKPFVINEDRVDVKGKKYFVLTDYEDSIPFSSKKYELAIPCKDTSIQRIYVQIINNKDTVFSNYTNDSFLSDLSLTENAGMLLLDSGTNPNVFRNFIINNFSNELSEGLVKIVVSKEKAGLDKKIFTKNVMWFNKPFSLRNPEFAISSLKYIEADSVISKLLDVDNSEYMKVLNDYWKKYDPTPRTKYNELMNEYYERVDYAFRNFAPLADKNGADTDRGRIFIKFGMPAKIERSSDEAGKVVELWIYTKENLSFKFVDKNGTGEFPLAKG